METYHYWCNCVQQKLWDRGEKDVNFEEEELLPHLNRLGFSVEQATEQIIKKRAIKKQERLILA